MTIQQDDPERDAIMTALSELARRDPTAYAELLRRFGVNDKEELDPGQFAEIRDILAKEFAIGVNGKAEVNADDIWRFYNRRRAGPCAP